jgi:flagellar hook-length control protein FliK
MLPTTAIKADSSSAAAGIKDKDSAALSLAANFSSYFSQMVAALPSSQAGLAEPPTPEAAPAPTPAVSHRADSAKKPSQSSTSSALSAASDGVNGGAQAGANAPAPAAASQTPQDPGQAGPASDQAAAPAATAVAGTQAAAVAGVASGAPGASSAKAAPAPDDVPTPAAGATAAAQTATPQSTATQDALAQAYPGGKFQSSYGDAETPLTTKAPLTELVNQIQMDTNASAVAQKDSASALAPAAAAAAAVPSPTPQIDLAAAFQAFQTPQLASQVTLLAQPTAESVVAGTSVSASAGAASNAAAAQAMGAGAQAGASGSVRVTASTSGDSARATSDPTPFSQVDGTIKWLVKNQDQGAELQLHPESLGQVQIKLKVEGTVVHAKVWASEASTVPILQDHRAQLETSLKAQGLTLGSFDLQHGHRQQQTPLPTPAATPSTPSVSLTAAQAGQDSPVSLSQIALHTSRIEYVA